jgi:hypothetical protein
VNNSCSVSMRMPRLTRRFSLEWMLSVFLDTAVQSHAQVPSSHGRAKVGEDGKNLLVGGVIRLRIEESNLKVVERSGLVNHERCCHQLKNAASSWVVPRVRHLTTCQTILCATSDLRSTPDILSKKPQLRVSFHSREGNRDYI